MSLVPNQGAAAPGGERRGCMRRVADLGRSAKQRYVKKIAAMILLVPFAMASGLFWGIAAGKIAKDKEPWFTLLMLCGLAVSVVVMTPLGGASVRMAAWVFLGTGILYVGLRFLFGKGSSLEMFAVPHLLAVMILLLLPALDRARQRARELRKPNQGAAANRRLVGPSGGSGNWTCSRPLARPCGPAACGSIPFAASQAAQLSATVAAGRAFPAAVAGR